ncbi:hypothetical protein [Streptomyces aureus]|uniref:hypothetical protein n=1 Tax=Streptomyces aureus TaxID=193461 RepID=UPI003400EB45
MAAEWGPYRPCTEQDTKAFLAIPGIVDYVTQGLKFKGNIDIVAEAVRCANDNSERKQYLVMGGQPTIEADEDNREGYAFVTGGTIDGPFKAIVLPLLS